MEPATSDLIKLVRISSRSGLDPCEQDALTQESACAMQARAGCNHLRAVCMSEWTLYKELFSSGETEA
jgi:hypothetical protein